MSEKGSLTETDGLRRRRIVLLFGGRSSEHGISCVTAAGVLRAIDRSRFDVLLVGVTRTGATVLLSEHDTRDYRLDGPTLPEVVANGTRVLWPASAETRALSVIESNGSVRSLGSVDAVVPLLHGPFGEDGTVQGLFELVDLPFVGSGVLGSALCMDKHAAKTMLAASGVAVAPWRSLTRSEFDREPTIVDRLDSGLRYPLFVKPNRAGSSLGVSRVSVRDELPAALDLAFAEDSLVIVEEGVIGREVEIAILQGRGGQAPRASSVVGEIVISGDGFYDFEAKYLGGTGVTLELPARVDDAELAALREVAVRAFEITQCAGLARIDFFLTDEGPVLNEINTMPGFTPISMYPRLWEASGLDYTALITELIELALDTHTRAAARN